MDSVSLAFIAEAGSSRLLLLFAGVSSLALAYLFTILASRKPSSDFWRSQPSVRRKQEWWSWTRATLRSITESQSIVAEGYVKVGFFSASGAPTRIHL